MGADAWVKTYSLYDGLAVEALNLGVGIKFVEVAHTQCKVGVGKQLDSLCLLHAHE